MSAFFKIENKVFAEITGAKVYRGAGSGSPVSMKLKCEVECKADVADFEEECESEYDADIGLKRKYVRHNVRLNKCESK